MKTRGLLILIVSAAGALAQTGRTVAITIDDLPRGGDAACSAERTLRINRKLLEPIAAQKVPVTGFVNAGKVQAEGPCRELGAKGLREILDLWLASGADLGNHTYSHAGLNETSIERYEEEIVAGEPAVIAALAARNRKMRFFRHPFLQTGPTLEKKRAVERFLADRGYRVAPVTLDNSDYMFAAEYAGALSRSDQ